MHIGINGWGELCTLCGREGHYADDCPSGKFYRETDPAPKPVPPVAPVSEPIQDFDEWYPEC